MKSPEIPPGSVDTYTDEQLDRVTRLVSSVFDVPVALATVVDEESVTIKWGAGFERARVDRLPGMCDEVVRSGRLVHLEDARKDPVASRHPFVTGGAGVVFYAGAPVRDRQGQIVGTLCLAGFQPRGFSAREREMLEDFADCVTDLLERNRAERERDAV
ncbi:MAG: GAF domain-containing protein, partial [bacterium]|nr:GAF domain-containing protein [bacterium]